MSNSEFTEVTLSDFFKKQVQNQAKLLVDGKYEGFQSSEDLNVPKDDVKLFSYHVQQMMSELGEVLEADKRWKNFRFDNYDFEAKKDELADVFIVWMNIVMFSGINSDEMSEAIASKLKVVENRIDSCK